MKRKTLISSILSMLLCFSLLVGSTYALFTSEASVNLSITSGKVIIESGVDETTIEMYSLDKKMDQVFANGGSVSYDSNLGELVLDNLTPGDKVNFNIYVKNESNIDIKYRITWNASGSLTSALKAFADGKVIEKNVTEWFEWSKDDSVKEKNILVSVELPVDTGNEFQESSAKINFYVEAIQANASELVNATFVSNLEEFEECLLNGGDIYLTVPININKNLTISNDTVIYGNENNTMSFTEDSQIVINNNASLKLVDVTVDNNDKYSFNDSGLLEFNDLESRNKASIFNVSNGATIFLSEGTVIKNVASKGSAVITANGTSENRSKVILEGARVENCSGKSGTVISANSNTDVYIEDGTVISGNLSYDCANHGILKIYSGSKLYINGGEIKDNIYSGNGLIGLWKAQCEMNGGKIYNNEYCNRENTWIDNQSTANGRYGLIYVHNTSLFTMNGGMIYDNIVAHKTCGVIDAINGYQQQPNVVINSGSVYNNYVFDKESKIEVFCAVYDKNHLVVEEEANVSGIVYYYMEKEFQYNNALIDYNGTLQSVSNESVLSKVEINNCNIEANTVIECDKPLELWFIDSTINADNVIKFTDNSINNTIVFSNCTFNLNENGKIISATSNNLPTVIYLLGDNKVGDVIITKDNYLNYFDNSLTVIF